MNIVPINLKLSAAFGAYKFNQNINIEVHNKITKELFSELRGELLSRFEIILLRKLKTKDLRNT